MAAPRRILLVEDDPAIASIIADILEGEYEVDGPYASLSDSAAAVAAHFPEGAILDVRLKDGDIGLLADDLDQYDIPYLFCTGAFAHPVIDAHPDAPLVEKTALHSHLAATLRKIIH